VLSHVRCPRGLGQPVVRRQKRGSGPLGAASHLHCRAGPKAWAPQLSLSSRTNGV
jgi:hypothetical protein